MNSIMAGVSILTLLFVWKFLWQRTLLDTTRDTLFDLRDDSRQWFIDNGYSLEHPIYVTLRNVLNCHLLNTENVSMIRFLSYIISRNKNKDYDEILEKKISSSFETDDKKILEYIDKVRFQAGAVLLLHMIKKSMFLSMLSFCITVIFFIKFALSYAVHQIASCKTVKSTYKLATAGALMFFFSVFSPGQTSNIRMEKFSATQVSNQSNLTVAPRSCQKCG